MAELVLTAEVGRPEGTRPARRLRQTGKVPGVVYGLKSEPISVAVDYRELRAVLTTDAGLNALIDLDVAGDRALSIVKELQQHPVRHDIVHVDFLRVDPDQPLQVEVPISLVGEPEAVYEAGGMVEQVMLTLTVLAKPRSIPNELVCDISALEIGHSVRATSIDLPEGVTADVTDEDVVAVGAIPKEPTIEEEELEEELEGEEGEEGEAAEGEAGVEGEAAGEGDSGGEAGGE